MTYFGLVISDIILSKYINYQIRSLQSYQKKIDVQKNDITIAKNLKKLGYVENLYPFDFNSLPFSALAENFHITPLGGLPDKDIFVVCNEGYGIQKYRTDKFGYRNRDEDYLKNIDILVVGDSFAEGCNVDSNSTISENLRLFGFNAINLGGSSNGPIEYAAIAKFFTPQLKPKFLVTLIYTNDNIDDTGSLIKKLYFEDGVEYFEKGNIKNGLSTRLIDLMNKAGDYRTRQIIEPQEKNNYDYFKLVNLKKYIGNLIDNLLPQKSFSIPLLSQTINSACNQNCKPIIIYIPNSKFWNPDYRADKFRNYLANFFISKEVEFIDATPYIEKEGLNSYSISGGHLSPLGYSMIADIIRKKIKEFD